MTEIHPINSMKHYDQIALERMRNGRPLVVGFHADCADGFTCVWLINRFLKEAAPELMQMVTCTPLKYNDPEGQKNFFAKAEGHDVLLVDFSYKQDELIELLDISKTVHIIDHHKTAFPEILAVMRYESEIPGGLGYRLTTYFDLAHSGAMLTYKTFWPNHNQPPLLVDYVQDRDLWLWDLPYSREISAIINSYGFSFENWDTISWMLENNVVLAMHTTERIITDVHSSVTRIGSAVLRSELKNGLEAARLSLRWRQMGTHVFPVMNLPRSMTSNTLESVYSDPEIMKFAKGPRFVASYYDDASGMRVWSLRSPDLANAADVAMIAKRLGGGGHTHSAGFTSATTFLFNAIDEELQ